MFSLTPYNKKNNGLDKSRDNWGIGNFFDNFFDDNMFPAFFSVDHPMKADIRETDKEYIVDVEIPGVKKEDIKLDLRDDVLTVSVERNEEVNEERENFIRKERRYGAYNRSFNVEGVKNEEVTAKYNDGILTINLPKNEADKKKSRNIEIN
jgi:HSP20 family protein